VGAQSGVALLVGWAFLLSVAMSVLALWAAVTVLELAPRLAGHRWLRRRRIAGTPDSYGRSSCRCRCRAVARR